MNITLVAGKISQYLLVTTKSLSSWLDQHLPDITENWWQTLVIEYLSYQQAQRVEREKTTSLRQLDLAALLRILDRNWYAISQKCNLTHQDRHYVKEMQTVRNRWAHIEAGSVFDRDDVFRDLDTLQRVLVMTGTEKSIIDELKNLKASVMEKALPEATKLKPPEEVPAAKKLSIKEETSSSEVISSKERTPTRKRIKLTPGHIVSRFHVQDDSVVFKDVFSALPDIDHMEQLKFHRASDTHNYTTVIGEHSIIIKRRDTPRAIVLNWDGRDRFFMKTLKRLKVIRIGPKNIQRKEFEETLTTRNISFNLVGDRHEGYFLFEFDQNSLRNEEFLLAIEESISGLINSKYPKATENISSETSNLPPLTEYTRRRGKRTDEHWLFVIKKKRNGYSNKEIIQELITKYSFTQGGAKSFVGSISCCVNALEGRSNKKDGIVFQYAQYLMGNIKKCPKSKDKASMGYVDKVFSLISQLNKQ